MRKLYNDGRPQFRWKQHPEMVLFIKENWVIGMTKPRLTAMVNAVFGTELTVEQVSAVIKNHHFVTGEGKNHKGKHYKWAPEIDQFLMDHPEMTAEVLVDELKERFSVRFTRRSIEDRRSRIGAYASWDGRFQKGDKRLRGRQFKPGEKSFNYEPIGTETIKSGYRYIKVSDDRSLNQTRQWRPLHHVIWEKEHGKIPKDKLVVFKDGDRNNVTLDNLMLASRSENAALTPFKKMGNADLTRAYLGVVRLRNRIKEKENKDAERT